jgi:hypothetical protein
MGSFLAGVGFWPWAEAETFSNSKAQAASKTDLGSWLMRMAFLRDKENTPGELG